MRGIRKIVWASDGSKESEQALSYAAFLAKQFGSQMMGIHVIPLLVPTPERVISESEFYNLTLRVESDINSRFSTVAQELSTQGISFEGVVLRGEPHKEIVEYARKQRADLIVMGKRGLALMDRMLTGSTTLRVLRESRVPVVAVKGRDTEGGLRIGNIVVPLDISEDLDSALIYAIRLAVKFNATLHVVYVFTMGSYLIEVPFGMLEEGLVNDSSNELANKIEKIKSSLINDKDVAKIQIKTEVIQAASPSVAIVDYANSKNVDLIVINTRARKGIRRFILGSVAEKVIQESNCPVLAMKP